MPFETSYMTSQNFLQNFLTQSALTEGCTGSFSFSKDSPTLFLCTSLGRGQNILTKLRQFQGLPTIGADRVSICLILYMCMKITEGQNGEVLFIHVLARKLRKPPLSTNTLVLTSICSRVQPQTEAQWKVISMCYGKVLILRFLLYIFD